MTRVELILDGDETAVIHVLSALLKRLLRDGGVRCKGITATAGPVKCGTSKRARRR